MITTPSTVCGFIQHLSGDTAIICAKWDSRYDEMVTPMKWSLRWNGHCDGMVTAMEWSLRWNSLCDGIVTAME